jgi:hypothetical protein
MDNTDPADPMLPMDSTEPTLPMDSTEPREPIERTELVDQSDKRELEDGMIDSHSGLGGLRRRLLAGACEADADLDGLLLTAVRDDESCTSRVVHEVPTRVGEPGRRPHCWAGRDDQPFRGGAGLAPGDGLMVGVDNRDLRRLAHPHEERALAEQPGRARVASAGRLQGRGLCRSQGHATQDGLHLRTGRVRSDEVGAFQGRGGECGTHSLCG